MKLSTRGSLAAAIVTTALAVPLLIAPTAHAADDIDRDDLAATEELVTDLNEQAVVRVETTVTGYVYDKFADLYLYDATSDSTDAVEVSTTYTCNGYVASSDGLVVTGGSCVDNELAAELLKIEAYYEVLDNGWLEEIYPQQTGEESDYFIQDFVVRSVDSYDNVDNRPEITTTVEFVDGVQAGAEVIARKGVEEGDLGLLRVDATGDLPAVQFATEPAEPDATFATLGSDATQGRFDPDYRTGTIGGEMRGSVYADHRLSTRSVYELDGAPVFDESGYLVGTLSPNKEDGDVLTSVARTEELLAEAGATNVVDDTTQALHDGIRAVVAGDRASAIAALERVLAAEPEHVLATKYLAEAESLPQPATDEPSESSSSPTPVLWLVVGGVAIAVVLVAVVIGSALLRRRPRATYGVPAAPATPTMWQQVPPSYRPTPSHQPTPGWPPAGDGAGYPWSRG